MFQGRGNRHKGKDHLSPPGSSINRLSDSDMSEFDFDDGMGVVTVPGKIHLIY